MDRTLFYALFDIPICSVYCNTLLANLNIRAYIAEQSTVEMDLPTFDAIPVGPQPLALTLKNGLKGFSQSGSRLSSELAA
jgi:hypothetical protein